jgi:protease I
MAQYSKKWLLICHFHRRDSEDPLLLAFVDESIKLIVFISKNLRCYNYILSFFGILKWGMQMKSVLIFVDEMYEDLELWYPKIRLEEEGCKVVVAGKVEGQTYKGKHGYPCKADRSIEAIDAKQFDVLVIPGGFAPDKLRRVPKVLQIVREFNEQKKVIAFICHAGWVVISAKILKDRKVTSVSAIKDDMENAGAIWSDQSVVVDKNLISSRTPADLPDFLKAIIKALQ